MNKYDVFKSEGGFRVCGGVWAGGPIMAQSPWFATQAEAEAESMKMKERDVKSAALDIIGGAPAELYSEQARQLAAKMVADITK